MFDNRPDLTTLKMLFREVNGKRNRGEHRNEVVCH
jgi:hypothetical protein